MAYGLLIPKDNIPPANIFGLVFKQFPGAIDRSAYLRDETLDRDRNVDGEKLSLLVPGSRPLLSLLG
jgi:hypothetical protein